MENIMFHYKTKSTCSREIIFDVEDNILTHCEFIRGCSGNAQGISKLVVGQDIDQIINKLAGINCRANTSCPDQLAQALIEYKSSQNA